MKKIIFGIFVIAIVFGIFRYSKQNETFDEAQYKKIHDEFFLEREGWDCYEIDSNLISVFKNIVESIKKVNSETNKQKYLQNKLKYYEEISSKHKGYIKYLIEYSKKELKNSKSSDVIEKNQFFENNKKIYLEQRSKVLPLYIKLSKFVDNDMKSSFDSEVSKTYFNKLSSALKTCQQISEIESKIPTIMYNLDSENNENIPLDDYETKVFEKLIVQNINAKKYPYANELFIGMIKFQILENDYYFGAVDKTIDEYALFLTKYKLNKKENMEKILEFVKSFQEDDIYEDGLHKDDKIIEKINKIIFS